jgi:hypothetical protein
LIDAAERAIEEVSPSPLVVVTASRSMNRS